MSIPQNIKIAVDAIVFGYAEASLQILLIQQKYGKLKGQWALVGGFVKDDEGLMAAVHRELQEETNIKVSYLEQLYTFGDDINRDPRFRVISVAYFGLVNSSALTVKADSDAVDARWFPVDQLPELAYDHKIIFQMALERLRNKLTYHPIGFDLLPETFPFSDLENLYASILHKEIDRRNFRKKILSFAIVEETDKYGAKKSGRPAKLFRFNKAKYNQLSKDGFHFEIKFA